MLQAHTINANAATLFTTTILPPANRQRCDGDMMRPDMRCAFRAAVAITAMLSGSVVGQERRLASTKADPLVGHWEGNSNYSTGTDGFLETFRLDFAEKNGRVTGGFIALERKHSTFAGKNEHSPEIVEHATTVKLPYRRQNLRNLVRTSAEPPTYRWYVDGECWNVVIEGQRMSALLNGGPCSSAGIGSGARLIELTAKRVNPERHQDVR